MASVPILSSSGRVQEMARDLGVVTESRLSLSNHVAAVCQSGYYKLWPLRPVVRCSSEDAVKTMVRAFVISRLDYYNALCYGIIDELTHCLQSLQNTAAMRDCNSFPPVLVRQCLGLTDRRLSARRRSPCQIAAFCWHSNARCQLDVLETGPLPPHGPQVWNSLPPNLKLCGLSYGQFRRLLKTFLFGRRGHGAVWTVFNCA